MPTPRRLLILILLLSLAGGLACYVLFLSPSALKAHVRDTLEGYLAADISVGEASLHPLRGLSLRGLRVRNAPHGETIFEAGLVRVRPRWRSLLRFKMEIAELTMRDASLLFTKDNAGRPNWAGVLRGGGIPSGAKPPVFRLTGGKLVIGHYMLQGLDCDLTPFASQNLLAIRGTVRDPSWGDYQVSGHVDSTAETVRLTLEGRDLNITEQWVRNFPFIGEDIWRRYRPRGMFDLTGNVTYCWRDAGKSDYSLLFTAQDASLRYLAFPVHRATGRLFIDPYSVVINHLDGELCAGRVEGYSIVNLDAPQTYFNRYTLEGVDMAGLLRLFDTEGSISGRGSGYVTFQGDQSMDTFEGQGVLSIPGARLWKFPIILLMLSKLQFSLWTGEEPLQDCTIEFSLSKEGVTFKKISLVSNVLDIYGEGSANYDGTIALTLYARPVSKTPIFLADLLFQPALDSLSGNLAQFGITGTTSDPKLTVLPLTPVSKQIINFFDALTRQRVGH